MVINSAGPVSDKNQSRRWLIFQRDVIDPAENDVSDATLNSVISSTQFKEKMQTKFHIVEF